MNKIRILLKYICAKRFFSHEFNYYARTNDNTFIKILFFNNKKNILVFLLLFFFKQFFLQNMVYIKLFKK